MSTERPGAGEGRPDRGELRIVARSDLGKIRGNNEDCVAFDARLGIAALADGMGGPNAGEVASATAIDVVMQYVVEQSDRLHGGAAAETLRDALAAANRRVHALAESRREYNGMGTTLVTAWVHDGTFIAAHVGDSRAYRFRRGELMRLTADHSLVQQLVAQGILSSAEARLAPNRNIVTRAIGIEADVECDVTEVDARDGDLFLLCSDGLTDMIDDAAIAQLCARHADADVSLIADALIEAALGAGGFDNVSVIVIAP